MQERRPLLLLDNVEQVLGTTSPRCSGPLQAFASSPPAGRRCHAGTTATYVPATLPELAAALANLTGEPHPLATAG